MKPPRRLRHRTSMPVSRATDPAGPRCRGSGDRRVPAGHRRERADRRADATDIPRQQIAIGMLNDVQCADRVKMLVYDGTGLVLIWKRLEGSKFKWPTITDGVMRLSAAQLAALFEGLDWRRVYAPRI